MSDLQDVRIASDKAGGRYQLRYAAGLYWLIDMKQSGAEYISPVPLNDVGAEIFRRLERGMTEAEISKWMCEEFDISSEQAQEDVRDFVTQLKCQKVVFGGTE